MLQTTPYKYYSSARRLPVAPNTSQGQQADSHYYATTDLIHWHNTNLLTRHSQDHLGEFL